MEGAPRTNLKRPLNLAEPPEMTQSCGEATPRAYGKAGVAGRRVGPGPCLVALRGGERPLRRDGGGGGGGHTPRVPDLLDAVETPSRPRRTPAPHPSAPRTLADPGPRLHFIPVFFFRPRFVYTVGFGAHRYRAAAAVAPSCKHLVPPRRYFLSDFKHVLFWVAVAASSLEAV